MKFGNLLLNIGPNNRQINITRKLLIIQKICNESVIGTGIDEVKKAIKE